MNMQVSMVLIGFVHLVIGVFDPSTSAIVSANVWFVGSIIMGELNK